VDLAREYGVSDSKIWSERKKRGIPKFDPKANADGAPVVSNANETGELSGVENVSKQITKTIPKGV